ncbi:MAG: cation transporter [Desulfobacteraceae bacterium]|jgi:copper chaperone CopZ
MENQTFTIQNISCGHCVSAIKSELNDLAGVKSVLGNPEDKSITVQWEAPATLEIIKNTLQEINYPAD